MASFIIDGGRPLSGTVKVSGSKNAALPVIFASLTARGVSTFFGLPDILDVRCALDIISCFGAMVTRLGDVTYIDTRELRDSFVPISLTSRLRASSYLYGACLARFGRAALSSPGGCNFSPRPIDLHIYAAECLGARLDGEELRAEGLSGAVINLRLPSVGATVNALIMAASAEGETLIKGAAREDHIDALIEYLVSAGALILREGDVIRVVGAELGGGEVKIPPDPIEAGTYLALSCITGGEVGVTGIEKESLSSFFSPLERAGACVKEERGALYLSSPPDSYVELVTAPHPGFPTDLGPVTVPLLSQGAGGMIRECVWPERFGYLSALERAGIRSERFGSYAKIYPSSPIGAHTTAPDLRGGAALLITALAAKGKSVIASAETVLRGYEAPVRKLSSLGASVRIEEK